MGDRAGLEGGGQRGPHGAVRDAAEGGGFAEVVVGLQKVIRIHRGGGQVAPPKGDRQKMHRKFFAGGHQPVSNAGGQVSSNGEGLNQVAELHP